MPLTLRDPPVVEVVCGFFFPALPRLDPMLVGRFWSERIAEYPTREMRPAVLDGGGLVLTAGVPPTRCWLLSQAGDYIVQVQQDRLYFNWRKVADQGYPRFGDHDGQPGVRSRALAILEEFKAFCSRQLEPVPALHRVELAKVNLVQYSSLTELGSSFPVVRAVSGLGSASEFDMALQFAEHVEELDVVVSVSNAVVLADPSSRALQLEIRVSRAGSGPFDLASMDHLNGALNGRFLRLLSDEGKRHFGALIT